MEGDFEVILDKVETWLVHIICGKLPFLMQHQ